VNGEIVVHDGRLTKVDEMAVLGLAEKSRSRLDSPIQRELAAARTTEPSLTKMYFRVFEKRDT